MMYKRHTYPWGFLAIEVAVRLQELLEDNLTDRPPYEYSPEALEAVDLIVRQRLHNAEEIRDELAAILSISLDCDFQPSFFAEVADFMQSRIQHILQYS